MKQWLNLTELVDVSGITKANCALWGKKPGCPKKRRGDTWAYEWPAWNDWRTAELVREARGERNGGAADYEKAKARREEAAAGLEELKLRKARGELVEVETARERLGVVVDVLARKIKAYPAKWSPMLVGCKTLAEVRKRLKPAVAELMTELAGLDDD